MTDVLWICFFASGASALAYEMLWIRSAALVCGGTSATNATVLATYFLGLAIGAARGARGAADPIRRYGKLEIGTALGALWSMGMFALLAKDAAWRFLAAGEPFACQGAVAIAILPATFCLGGTLPALGQALAAGAVGRRGGLLYALNTIGAALGAAAAGFGLPALIGVKATYVLAILVSCGAGLAALVVGDRPAATVSRPVTQRWELGHRLRIVAASTGALGLGLEVLWIRLFAQVLHNSVYSFTAVAIAFLLAIAVGAALAAWLLRRLAAERVAATALVAAGIATVAGYWMLRWSTDGLAYFGMRTGLGEYVLRILVLAFATAGPAALAGAAVLPAIWEAFGERPGAARPLGEVAAANALGGVAGALLMAFVAIPLLGVRTSLLLAAVAYVLLAELVLPSRNTRRRILAAAALLAIVVADPLRAPLTHLANAGESVQATLEGPSGIVSVVDTGGDMQLRLDGFYTLGGSASAANERRQGLLPLLLHPDPRRVIFLGLATGITASAAPALGVPDTTVVELVPEVATAARQHFRRWNDGLLQRPDVHLIVDDGRRHLAVTNARFDVIVSDLFIPWHAGTGALYAREMYATAAARLAPGGLFCQWLPLYQLTRDEFDVIVRTVLSIFPYVTLWRDDFYADRPVVALVGLLAPRTLDLEALAGRMALVREPARDPLLRTPRGLVMLYAGDLSGADDLFAHAPINRDDRPLIEFLAPRLTRMSNAGDKDWFTGESLAAFYQALEERPAPRRPLVPATEEAASARLAGLALFRYALATARHDEAAAAGYEGEVRRRVPEVIAGADLEGGAASAATTGDDAFATLRRDQDQLRREITDMEDRLVRLRKEGS
jgi:spermidine synthase